MIFWGILSKINRVPLITQQNVKIYYNSLIFYNGKNVLYGIKHVGKMQWEIFETFEARLVVLSKVAHASAMFLNQFCPKSINLLP